MQDWKGNFVKEGDVVVIYRIAYPKRSFSFGFFDTTNKTYEKVKDLEIPEKKYCWELEKTYDVVRMGEHLFLQKITPDGNYMFHVNCFDQSSQNHAICIEGKSDNETDFYLNYFAV